MTRLAASILLAALAMLVLAAEARGGTYVVRQCHEAPGENRSHEANADTLPTSGPYTVNRGAGVCTSAANDFALGVTPRDDALSGQYGRLRFDAPPGTSFVRVEVDARLRRELGHVARLAMTGAAGGNRITFGAGDSEPTGFEHYTWPSDPNAEFGAPRQRFEAGLECASAGGCTVEGSGFRAKTQIRNLRMTVRDSVAPTLELRGGLVDGGWIRGESRIAVEAEDVGGGVFVSATAVNGDVISAAAPGCADIRNTKQVGRLSPCALAVAFEAEPDAGDEPFTEGLNRLQTCAVDFGTNPNTVCETRNVLVDTEAPSLAFAAHDPADPELIRAPASDETSGLDSASARLEYQGPGETGWTGLPTRVKGGALEARINSEQLPPGEYSVRAGVTDVAGNPATSTKRADGEPVKLRLPLKDAVRLSATLGNGDDDQTVNYRRDGRVIGRLLDAAGRPLSGEAVSVLEAFDQGSLISERERTVTTDARGRFASKLPPGPSRDVAVSYAGSRRYLAEEEAGLDFHVRGATKLKISRRRVRAGKAVAFKGRVRRYFARIPTGGKLVEVQVKSGRKWTTLQEATGTDARGRVRLRHRFRGFYTQPVTFTFRLKATRENGWPYRGAAKSRKRRVTVLPKR